MAARAPWTQFPPSCLPQTLGIAGRSPEASARQDEYLKLEMWLLAGGSAEQFARRGRRDWAWRCQRHGRTARTTVVVVVAFVAIVVLITWQYFAA